MTEKQKAKGAAPCVDACCTIGPVTGPGVPPESLLEEMDRAGVDWAVAHPPDDGYAFENEEGNALTTGAAKRHSDRLIAAVTANPWRRDAWDCLRKGLRAGGRILSFSPGIQGFNPADGRIDPILEKLAKEEPGIPVYIHTGHHSLGAPSQLFLLARRFPEIHFIMGHAGATDYAGDVVPVCRQSPNIYVESSFARPPGFIGRIKAVGWDRGIMGSGYPLNGMMFEWSEIRRLLPADHQKAVLGGNLASLIGGLR